MSVFPKNASHFQQVREFSKYLYGIDLFRLIPILEAVNKLGAGFPSSDPYNKHACQSADAATMADQPYL